MARLFDRNMFIMLLAIMVGVIIITYFVGDIVNRTRIEELTLGHQEEIVDIQGRNENFTDNFLQGSIKMDSAREKREMGNYHYDLGFLWFTVAIEEKQNITQLELYKTWIIDNCTNAMTTYLTSNTSFGESKPFFEAAKLFTDKQKYLEVLGYYTSFAQVGQNITLLRHQAAWYLKCLAENLSIDLVQNENFTELLELFNDVVAQYDEQLEDYVDYKDQIDGYLFFEEIREVE